MTLEALTLTTADGVTLEAELATAAPGGHTPTGMVLCHPHPLQGGTMRSIVISALFGALPEAGVTCLRFNFRGVGESGGEHGHGDDERLDALAAIDALSDRLSPAVPMVLAGWSFGADVALSVHDARLAGWLAIACPLRFVHDQTVLAADPRPKLLVLAQHDEIRTPEDIAAEAAGWSNTTIAVVPGASHFFVGATDKLVVLARDFASRVAGGAAG